MRHRSVVASVLLGLFALFAYTARAEIDPAKEADIRRLMELSKADEQVVNMKPLLSQQMRSVMYQMLLGSLPPEKRDPELVGRYADRFVQVFMERFETDEILNRMIPIYDKYYTHEEIKGIIQFLESPLGKRLIEVTPQVMQESFKKGSEYGEEIGRQVGAEIGEEMLEELRDREEEFPHLPIVSNEASAVESLRTIVTAGVTYLVTYAERGFPAELANLGPPAAGSKYGPERAGFLLDEVLASGTKNGYTFEFITSDTDGDGALDAFQVSARPVEYGKTGRRSFFTDESGVIRSTEENRLATATDPPVQ